MENPDVVAQARVIYWQFQADHLAATPLSAMADWVASGDPPPAEALRSIGFSGASAPATPKSEDLEFARKAFVRAWGYAIPCREAVVALRKLGPLLEIGAGSGYWSAMLRAAGHDAIATDLATGTSAYGTLVGEHYDVECLGAVEAIERRPGRDLFCSWPGAGEAWATEAVSRVAAGRSIALILDDRPEMTGDAALRAFLAAECEVIESVTLPQFPGVCDRLVVYRRR
jgi:hypothetical protein